MAEAVRDVTMGTADPVGLQRPVDIIVPIHNQFDLTRVCLESVIATVRDLPGVQVIALDDASTDERMLPYLVSLEECGRVQVLKNEENLGFVRTVNRGMLLNADHDVLLLNSDTRVYGDWILKLGACAYSHDTIATSNPFTTHYGTHISGYPSVHYDVQRTLEISDEDLHEIANRANGYRFEDVHTTVGFCMFIKRRCIDNIGVFDSVNFPLAYGEESDFCYRARRMGWRHVVAGGVFVSHMHGQSYGTKRARLMQEMLVRFRELHPDFIDLDRGFYDRDPLRDMRYGIDLLRLRRLSDNGAKAILCTRASCGTTAPSWGPVLSVDPEEDTLAFRLPNPASFPNLQSFLMPRDIADLNHALAVIGVEQINCDASETRQALQRMIQGLDFELQLTAEVAIAPGGRNSGNA